MKIRVFILSILLGFVLSNTMSMAAVITTKGDFEDEKPGTPLTSTGDFSFDWGMAIIEGVGQVSLADGNKFLSVSGYSEFYSFEPIEGPYTFSIDIKMDNPRDVNVFVRAGRNDDFPFPFYEWDWYSEGGGKNGVSSTGGPGLIVSLLENGVRVRIKNMQTDSENERISSVYYDFTDISNYDYKKFNNIKFIDDGNKVEIYFNESLLATCEMSDKGTYDGDSGPVDFVYFKKAVLKNAAGEEVLSLDNARLVAESYRVAFGGRNSPFYADNIAVTYEVEDTPEPTQTPDATPKPTSTPSRTNSNPNRNNSGKVSPVMIGAIAVGVIVIAGLFVVIVRKRK